MGIFGGNKGPTQQEQFDQIWARTLQKILQTSLTKEDKERFAVQFLSQAKAITEDKSCDPIFEVNRAANDISIVVGVIDRARKDQGY